MLNEEEGRLKFSGVMVDTSEAGDATKGGGETGGVAIEFGVGVCENKTEDAGGSENNGDRRLLDDGVGK